MFVVVSARPGHAWERPICVQGSAFSSLELGGRGARLPEVLFHLSAPSLPRWGCLVFLQSLSEKDSVMGPGCLLPIDLSTVCELGGAGWLCAGGGEEWFLFFKLHSSITVRVSAKSFSRKGLPKGPCWGWPEDPSAGPGHGGMTSPVVGGLAVHAPGWCYDNSSARCWEVHLGL